MRSENINHNDLLEAIFKCDYTTGYAEIKNTLNKEWELKENSNELFEGTVLIKANGGVLTVYFKKDSTVSFLCQGKDIIRSKQLFVDIMAEVRKKHNKRK